MKIGKGINVPLSWVKGESHPIEENEVYNRLKQPVDYFGPLHEGSVALGQYLKPVTDVDETDPKVFMREDFVTAIEGILAHTIKARSPDYSQILGQTYSALIENPSRPHSFPTDEVIWGVVGSSVSRLGYPEFSDKLLFSEDSYQSLANDIENTVMFAAGFAYAKKGNLVDGMRIVHDLSQEDLDKEMSDALHDLDNSLHQT